MMKQVFGIDFGTTNSAIGAISTNSEDVNVVPIDQGHTTIPTALFYGTDNSVSFGREAINSYIDGEDGRFIRSIKRILGTDLMEKATIINNKSIKFDNIIQTFLNHVKKTAENTCHCEIESVILGRPVHFQDNDQIADIKAQNKLETIAKQVGFNNIVFQYEPIAAAFAHERHLDKDKLACVIDLGGGTSDFTIIEIGPSHHKLKDRYSDILATYGIRVGGNDLDREFSLSSFMPEFGKGTLYGQKQLQIPLFLYTYLSEWSKINFCYTLQNKLLIQDILNQSNEPQKIKKLYDLVDFQLAHHLLKITEDTKINLTNLTQTHCLFNELKEEIAFEVTRKDFELSIESEVKKIYDAISETLKIAKVKAEDIQFIILTGGTCEVPIVKSMIRKIFPNAHLTETEKMESVCIGLTLSAKRLFY